MITSHTPQDQIDPLAVAGLQTSPTHTATPKQTASEISWTSGTSGTSDSNGLPTREELSLLSVVAHELRNPLSSLALSSQLLVEDFEVLDPEQARRMAVAVHRGATWLQGLVENLLCAVTISEGRFQILPQPISLTEVVMEIKPVVEPLLAHRGQRLRLRSPERLPDVVADGRRIGQVLVNLILNASKFSEPSTPIDVLLISSQENVRVSVADRGPGLPEGSERLFKPFYRTAAAVRSGKEGVGLGLAIVRWIVEAHDGRVGANNRRGPGARFWFELPVARGA